MGLIFVARPAGIAAEINTVNSAMAAAMTTASQDSLGSRKIVPPLVDSSVLILPERIFKVMAIPT